MTDLSEDQANAINEQMVRQMELRRQKRAERRTRHVHVQHDRRKTCAYCFQPGDHRTPTDCYRALGGWG
jgi:hypothetical protein